MTNSPVPIVPTPRARCGYVYGIQSGLFIKIGVAVDIQERIRTFQLGNPHPMKIVMRRKVTEAHWVEARLHQILASHSIGREWFMITTAQAREAMRAALADLKEYRKWMAENEKKVETGTERGKVA